MIIEEYLYQFARQTPNQMAIADESICLTYEGVWNAVSGTAYYLRYKKGLKKGSGVLIRATQTVGHAIAYMAVHLCGGIAVPVEKDLAKEEYIKIAKLCDAKISISFQQEINKKYQMEYLLWEEVQKEGMRHAGLWIPECEKFPSENDIADIMFTTGTTGKSKGVLLSHGNLKATAENITTGYETNPTDRIIVVGPLNHANAIRKVYTSMFNHSAVVIADGMKSIKEFYELLDRYEVNAMCLPPSAVGILLKISGDKIGEYRDKMRYVENSTAPMPEHLKRELCRLLPETRLYNCYGSSEAGAILIYDYNKYKGKLGCLGIPSKHADLFLSNENYECIPSTDGQSGFLACRGAVNMQGYLKDPELTRKTLKDGCVYTTDLVFVRSDGFYYSRGRVGEVINSGGLKIAPTEVEEVIELCPGVEECMLIPVKDELLGQKLKLLVVGKKGLSLHDLKEYMKDQLESYKIPRIIEQVDQLPKTYNGKKDRKIFYTE